MQLIFTSQNSYDYINNKPILKNLATSNHYKGRLVYIGVKKNIVEIKNMQKEEKGKTQTLKFSL